MTAVAGGAADVVDGARRLRHPVRQLLGLVERCRDHPRHRAGRAEGGPDLADLLVHAERERDDRDHHRVPGPDLHERLPRPRRTDAHGDDQLVLGEGIPLRADEEVPQRQRPRPTGARKLDLGAVDEQRRQRVAGRRGRTEIPADRPAVADLRPADGTRGFRERAKRFRERHGFGVRQPGAKSQAAVLARPASQLGYLVQVQQRRRPRAVEVELHHQVGTALDRNRFGPLGLQAQRLIERARGEDVHRRQAYFASTRAGYRRPVDELTRRLAVARGDEPADLVVRGGLVLSVFTREWLETDVAVVDGFVAGLGEYEGTEELDASGRYVVPGFIDAHVHLESSKLMLDEFARLVLPLGTTTVVVDPHEIANVLGTDGVHWLLDACAE